MKRLSLTILLLLTALLATNAQDFNEIDVDGNVSQRQKEQNRNFNPHSNDTTSTEKEVPKGIYVWSVDRKFGDIRPADVDTIPHLYPNTTLNTGAYGEFNTTGSNYTPRINRIVTDRPLMGQFIFTEPYSFICKNPDQVHFTNTLSPITNLSYDNCGDKTDGEDHLQAKFAVNAGKRIGLGFDLNYMYARGYFSDQPASHFSGTVYGSYLGDQYNMHILFSALHQKVSENGGITKDDYITHPEAEETTYITSEIPTVLNKNWNRNDHTHLFLTHRYNIGFYRGGKKVEVTDSVAPAPIDTARIVVDTQEKMDSLLALEKKKEEAANDTADHEFVPVTSIIHTFEFNTYDRIYQAYGSPTDYYANSYFKKDRTGNLDSLYDETKHRQLKNTLALALLEGFNKYAKAGLKAFVTHELRTFKLDELVDEMPVMHKVTEHNISIGGQLIKSQGHTLHYNAMGELWTVGEDAGQLKLDFNSDLNFKLFGDTVTLAAHAHFYRLNPSYYQRHYHSKHFWWDNDDLSKETRTRIEGTFSYRKTRTSLRVAIEEIQNYTYLGMSYLNEDGNRKYLTATMNQHGSNINLLTAQLRQHFKLGVLNWENVITYQNSSNKEVLPVPDLNIFSNFYLGFQIAHVLSVELGACATYFTEYEPLDYCPQLNQYAVQENTDSRVTLGNFPFVDVYANLHLKRARFFIMMNNVTGSVGNRKLFLTPHYPLNDSVLHLGVSWNFFN